MPDPGLPSLHERLAHALTHDVVAPLAMAPVLVRAAAGTGGGERAEVVAGGLDEVRRLAEGMATGLRAPVAGTGATDGDALAARARAAFHVDAADGDTLEVGPVVAVPLPSELATSVIDELVAHALADRGSAPRRVGVSVEAGDGVLGIVVDDDGPPPDLTLRDPVRRPRDGRGSLLLHSQRLAEHLGGTLAVVTSPWGGCRATLRLPARGNP